MKSTAMQFTLPSAMRATLIGSVAVLAALGGLNRAWAQYDPGQTNLALGRRPPPLLDEDRFWRDVQARHGRQSGRKLRRWLGVL